VTVPDLFLQLSVQGLEHPRSDAPSSLRFVGALPDAELASVPANARVVEFVPFADLLPHASVLVSDGGYGGVQMALRHGVPLVLVGSAPSTRDTTRSRKSTPRYARRPLNTRADLRAPRADLRASTATPTHARHCHEDRAGTPVCHIRGRPSVTSTSWFVEIRGRPSVYVHQLVCRELSRVRADRPRRRSRESDAL
jgi:hypothetical protein